jgi:hypothetical protein
VSLVTGRNLLEDEACDAVDVDGIGSELSESRTIGLDELLRELLPFLPSKP